MLVIMSSSKTIFFTNKISCCKATDYKLFYHFAEFWQGHTIFHIQLYKKSNPYKIYVAFLRIVFRDL